MQEGEGYLSATVNESAAGSDVTPSGPAQTGFRGQLIRQLIGAGVAIAFLYWTFKGQDFALMWRYVQKTDVTYLFMIIGTGLASHLFRAWRWILLLKPLSDKPISLWNAFCAVMYGYAVNVVLPRGGEIARIVAISKSESIPWAGVLPTMFIDRLLDIAMLVLLIGLTITRLPSGILDPRLTGPTGLIMCAAVVFGLVVLPFVASIGRIILGREAVKKIIPSRFLPKLDQLLEQFDLGTRALTSLNNLLLIGLFSLLIWVCYFGTTLLSLRAFHLENVVSMWQALVIFTVSTVSVLIPTPGSAGSYHFFTSQAFQKVAGVNPTESLAIAAVTHLLSFVIITCVPAALCFAVQSFCASKSKR